MGNLQHTRYTGSVRFRCLENLRETSLDLSLIHCGKEQCQPLHIWQGVRHEYIIHFVLSGKGIYSTEGKTWTLGAGQMFLIYPETEITYISDASDPWRYAWIGFSGIRADSILRNCGFSSHKPVLSTPPVGGGYSVFYRSDSGFHAPDHAERSAAHGKTDGTSGASDRRSQRSKKRGFRAA